MTLLSLLQSLLREQPAPLPGQALFRTTAMRPQAWNHPVQQSLYSALPDWVLQVIEKMHYGEPMVLMLKLIQSDGLMLLM